MPTSADYTFTARDFPAIFNGMVSDIPNKTPEWTNQNVDELGIAILNLLAEALDKLSAGIDNNALEAFLTSAIALPDVQASLRTIDYDMTRNLAATVQLQFTLNNTYTAPITIPGGTIVATQAGIQFVTMDDVTIPAGALSPVTYVTAYQGTYHVDGPYTSNGQPLQNYPLAFMNVADNFLNVTVDGTLWTEEKRVPNFPSLVNTIYRATENVDATCTLNFSQYFGVAPSNNQSIVATYISTDPTVGSVGAGLITTIISALTLPSGYTLTVTNPLQSTTGTPRETIPQAQVNGPRALRTLNRAVTLQDFLDLIYTQTGVDDVQAIDHAGFVEMHVRLTPTNNVYPLFKVEPPVQNNPVDVPTGGSIANSLTFSVAITAIDAAGNETNASPVNPSSGATLNNPVTLTSSNSGSGTHTIYVQASAIPANAVAFNVYAGLTPAAMYLVNHTPLTAAQVVTSPYAITTIPVLGTLCPTANLAATQNPATNRSYYQDFYDFLEPKRLLCTAFDLFNAVAIPQNISLAIYCQPNYRQSAVQTAVQNALKTYFVGSPIGAPLYIADLMQYLLQNAPGVLNVNVLTPSGDVSTGVGQYLTLGSVTIALQGGTS